MTVPEILSWNYYYCLQKIKDYLRTKFRRHISVHDRVLEKQTSTILELYSRFLLRPYQRNRRVIPHKFAKLQRNRAIHSWVMTSYLFSRW